VLFQVQDGHVGSFLCKAGCNGPPDAAVAAGDHGHLASQLVAATVAFCRRRGCGVHVAFATGLDVLVLWRQGGGLFVLRTHGFPFSGVPAPGPAFTITDCP